MSRMLAIGDIHGCDVALDVLLSRLQPEKDDTVVLLGDVVDRGPNTREVIERLLDLQQTCKLILIKGNHEEMMLDSLLQKGSPDPAWLSVGGQEVIDSYGRFTDVPQEHWLFLDSALPYWETDTEIFVHANLEPGVALERQPEWWLRWERFRGFEPPAPSGKRVVCGHTSQKSGLPKVIDGWICIDTWVYGRGYLTCLDVTTDELYQARQTDASFRRLHVKDLT